MAFFHSWILVQHIGTPVRLQRRSKHPMGGPIWMTEHRRNQGVALRAMKVLGRKNIWKIIEQTNHIQKKYMIYDVHIIYIEVVVNLVTMESKKTWEYKWT